MVDDWEAEDINTIIASKDQEIGKEDQPIVKEAKQEELDNLTKSIQSKKNKKKNYDEMYAERNKNPINIKKSDQIMGKENENMTKEQIIRQMQEESDKVIIEDLFGDNSKIALNSNEDIIPICNILEKLLRVCSNKKVVFDFFKMILGISSNYLDSKAIKEIEFNIGGLLNQKKKSETKKQSKAIKKKQNQLISRTEDQDRIIAETFKENKIEVVENKFDENNDFM